VDWLAIVQFTTNAWPITLTADRTPRCCPYDARAMIPALKPR
jgi:hypothetical protein